MNGFQSLAAYEDGFFADRYNYMDLIIFHDLRCTCKSYKTV